MLRRFLLLGLLATAASAQPADTTALRLVVDGAATAWPLERGYPADSLGAASRRVLEHFQREGYYLASLDSVARDREAVTLHLRRGERVEVAAVEVEGAVSVGVEALREGMRTRPGAVLDAERLRGDLDAILLAYERAGFPLAEASVASAEIESDGLHLTIRIEERERLAVERIEFVPAGRTSPGFAARVAGLAESGGRFDPERIRRELEDTGLFDEVGTPELALGADGAAFVRVPASELPPGTFDLVFGYLPPSGTGDDGAVVGNGSLVLTNLFGHGRALAVRLVRNPGLVSSLDASFADPFVLGLPLRVEARFSGYQQDSTFQRQRFGAEAGYRFAPGLEALATVSREFVDAGIGGVVLVEGRQRIPEADAWFAGAGVRFRRTDSRLNPRRGLFAETLLEQGVKRRDLGRDTTDLAAPVSIRQQRLAAAGRAFVPTLPRQVLVLGADAAVLLGDVYDDSDLFRFGGATSLRGYDEEQFRGNVVGRALVEYRYQIDRTSFAFLFADVGVIRRPETPGVPAEDLVRPGYGFGLQYRTPLGLVAVSYALNPDDGPTRGKVHLGLSFGL